MSRRRLEHWTRFSHRAFQSFRDKLDAAVFEFSWSVCRLLCGESLVFVLSAVQGLL
jgi:hypothetical protein